jgi:hypothetical protein
MRAIWPVFALPGLSSTDSNAMLKYQLLSAIQTEIYKHDFGIYIDDPPSVAQGGRVAVAGCPACKKAAAVYE